MWPRLNCLVIVFMASGLPACAEYATDRYECISEGMHFLYTDTNLEEQEFCCSGLDLLPRCVVFMAEGGPACYGCMALTCARCPNDTCGPGEDIANCPQDCPFESYTEDPVLYPTVDDVVACRKVETSAWMCEPVNDPSIFYYGPPWDCNQRNGYSVCDHGDYKVCAHLPSDDSHCGECGRACTGGTSCQEGECHQN